MSDDALREVLRSPLDDLPPSGRGAWAAVAVLLVAAGCGFGVGAGVRALQGPSAEETPDATTTTEVTTSSSVPESVAVGEVAVQAAAAFRQGGKLYLVVTTTVLPGADPEETAGVGSAHWVLRLANGDLVTATGEHTTPVVPGVFTVEFPDADISSRAQLLIHPAEEVIERTYTTTRDSAQFPWEGPLDGDGGVLGAPYRLGGQEIAFHRTRLDDAGGELGWYLLGDSVARAAVGARSTYTEVDAGPQAIVAEGDLPRAYLVAGPSSAPPARSGGLHLFHLDDAADPSFRSRFWGDPERVVAVRQLVLEIFVRLYRYSATPTVIPLNLSVAEEG